MIFLSWNSRGRENPQEIRVLCGLVKGEAPEVLFMQETRLINKVMVRQKVRLGFENCLVVSCKGRSGGLALF